MGKLSKTEASHHLEGPGYEGHIGEIEGTTVSFETYTEDADLSPPACRTTTATGRTGGRS